MRSRFLVAAVAAALLLAGCRVDVSVAVVVEEDGSGTVTVTAVTDAELTERAPNLATDLRLDDFRNAGWTVDGPSPDAAGGLRVVLTHPFTGPDEANALLAQLSGSAGPFTALTLSRTIDGRSAVYTVDGTVQLAGGLDAFADEQLRSLAGTTPFATSLSEQGLTFADVFSINLAMQLPGELQATNGDASDGTVAWVVPLDGSALTVDAESKQGGGKGGWRIVTLLALAALVAWMAVSGAFIAFVLRTRRGRQSA